MAPYLMTWITDQLAVGYAPMSYEELDSIKEQGIDAIVNLCGEFSDLHEIEEKAGFEVFYLPVADETAPEMQAMEEGLAWLDEAMYLGKKVLIHCRHGIGRTGTFVTAYLLRRGFTLGQAGKLLKKVASRANPTNFSQWWLLRRFSRKEGEVISVAPSPVNRNRRELGEYYKQYELLLRHFQPLLTDEVNNELRECGERRCHTLQLTPIEALYFQEQYNRRLPAARRQAAIERISRQMERGGREDGCPLRESGFCLAAHFAVIRSILLKADLETMTANRFNKELENLSRSVFFVIFDWPITREVPRVSMAEVISGKFVQVYFQYILTLRSGGQ